MSKDSNLKDCLALSKIVLLQWVAQGILKSKIVIMRSSDAWKKKQKAFWYNMNITQITFMRFIFSVKSIYC